MAQSWSAVHPLNTDYVTRKVFPAGDWALDEPETTRAVVGRGQRILWATGETLMICADTGNGKSTLTQNIIRAGIGLIPDILSLAVRDFKSVLYVAADRPSQIRSSLRRMVNESNRQVWNDRVYIHHGPPEFVINEEPQRLLPFVRELSEKLNRPPFDCLVLDSLKDVVSKMDENEDGININRSLQSVCQQGLQVGVNIHPRKMGNGRDKERNPILDDVGGNKNIIAGAGSVLYIGAPGNDGNNELYHLKSPAEPIEGYSIFMERRTGDISCYQRGL